MTSPSPSTAFLNPTAPSALSLEAIKAAQTQPPNRRPRPVLSCISCRRKKLKCDRLFPCNQCRKVGAAAGCEYYSQPAGTGRGGSEGGEGNEAEREGWNEGERDERGGDGGTGRKRRAEWAGERETGLGRRSCMSEEGAMTAVEGRKGGVLEDLQARVESLEGLLAAQVGFGQQQKAAKLKSADIDHVKISRTSSANHQGVLNSKGARTRYFGPNHKLALLNRFEHAMNYCVRGFPGMSSLMDEFRSFQKATSRKAKPKIQSQLFTAASALTKMHEILPPRSVCDSLIGSYFYNGEKSLRIIHIPSFLHDFQDFWDESQGDSSRFNGFVPLLFAAMLVGSSWDDGNVLSASLAKHGFSEADVCGMLTVWLEGLSWKKRIQLSTLRTHCLLYMAHHLHLSAPMELIWCTAGSVVRSAMTMGLHRDPAEFLSISIFEAEQRRRLWMTVVEMDLQSSIISGCPAMVREGNYNCMPPANVDDVQLFEAMVERPLEKPLDEWTDTSCQVVLARSLPLRLRAVSLANNIQNEPDYEELLEVGRKLEAFIEDLPAVVSFGHQSSGGPGRLVGQMVLEAYLRRVLICLYTPFALGAGEDATFLEGRRACIQAALTILSRQDSFDPDVADLKVINSKRYWDAYHLICKTDVMQAALTVCLEIKAMSEASSTSHGLNGPPPASELTWHTRPTLSWTKATLTRAVENTLSCLLRRIGQPGSDLRDVLALSMTLQSARLGGSQKATEAVMKAGAMTVLKACRLYFHGDSVGVNGLEKPANMSMAAVPLSTPPAGIEEVVDTAFESRPIPTFDGFDFPMELNGGLGDFDLFYYDMDGNWGEGWS